MVSVVVMFRLETRGSKALICPRLMIPDDQETSPVLGQFVRTPPASNPKGGYARPCEVLDQVFPVIPHEGDATPDYAHYQRREYRKSPCPLSQTGEVTAIPLLKETRE